MMNKSTSIKYKWVIKKIYILNIPINMKHTIYRYMTTNYRGHARNIHTNVGVVLKHESIHETFTYIMYDNISLYTHMYIYIYLLIYILIF